MEEEILSSFAIENIRCNRDSVRRILAGDAPSDADENRIHGMKKALAFIADPGHAITEENFLHLYEIAIAPFLPDEDKLLPGNQYRHDAVHIVGGPVEHTGLNWQKLPEYMSSLVTFLNGKDQMNDLLKAALIHFYFAYLHPYFDGNGRMARLLHLWYLVQQGYPSALFVSLSKHISESRKAYYTAFTLVEENTRIRGALDVTPFLIYFVEKIYLQLDLYPEA